MDIEYASKSLEKSLKDQRAITRNYGKIAKNLSFIVFPICGLRMTFRRLPICRRRAGTS